MWIGLGLRVYLSLGTAPTDTKTDGCAQDKNSILRRGGQEGRGFGLVRLVLNCQDPILEMGFA